jgi:hypothetical protein
VLLGPPVERGDHDLTISAASLAELHFGVTVAASEPIRAERLRRLALVESLFTPLHIDATVGPGAPVTQPPTTADSPASVWDP